jgi:regulator of sirC expression with transglutaminase-like and TPR domain
MLTHMHPSEFIDRQEEERATGDAPSTSSMRAAISLLTDQDPAVAQMCRTQILTWGEHVRPLLEQAAGGVERELCQSAAAMLRRIDLQDWRRRVAQFASGVPRVGQMSFEALESGALLLSSMGRHKGSVDAAGVAATLDAHADELRPRFHGKSAMTCARLLTGYLSNQVGYGGSQSSFYEVANIQFDDVVMFRRGVPVALALLFILVGRRAGIEVTGVAIPDHFLVRIHGTRPVLIDPYHEGRQVTKADCVRYLRIAGYSLHTTSYLEDVPDCQILDCLLRNLLRVYGYREDHELCSALENARRAIVRT